MDKYNKVLGKVGEDAAEKFLKGKGYKILDRNFNCRFGELDIIAMDGNCLVFAEVKTRSTKKYGAPQNAVNYRKQNHLKLSARFYIEKERLNNYIARFDIVEIFVKFADNKFIVENINVISNAF